MCVCFQCTCLWGSDGWMPVAERQHCQAPLSCCGLSLQALCQLSRWSELELCSQFHHLVPFLKSQVRNPVDHRGNRLPVVWQYSFYILNFSQEQAALFFSTARSLHLQSNEQECFSWDLLRLCELVGDRWSFSSSYLGGLYSVKGFVPLQHCSGCHIFFASLTSLVLPMSSPALCSEVHR